MDAGHQHVGGAGRVLVVCTGNVCRSPYIERRLAGQLRTAGVHVSSAGTGALVGSGMDQFSEKALLRAGGDGRGFVASEITAQAIAQADLVLTATRHHRGLVARLFPRAMSYSFTLGDFRDLVDGLDPHTLGVPEPDSSWVAHVTKVAASRRGLVPPRPAAAADIVDPYGRDESVFAEMAEQVERELAPVVAALTRPRWL